MKKTILAFYTPTRQNRIPLSLYKRRRIFLYINLIFVTHIYGLLTYIFESNFSSNAQTVKSVISIVYSILSIYLLYLLMDISRRRLHDIGRSGWWVGIPIFLLIRLWLGLEMEGEPGENKWGVNDQEGALKEGMKGISSSKLITLVYRSAAYSENDRAQCLLGRLYLNGHRMKKNKQLAIFWLLRAAENNNKKALEIIRSLHI